MLGSIAAAIVRRGLLSHMSGRSVVCLSLLSVCVRLLAMTVSPAKKDDPTQMPFYLGGRIV